MEQYRPYPLAKASVAAAKINNVLCTRDFPYAMTIGRAKALLRPLFSPPKPLYSHALLFMIGEQKAYITLQGDAWFFLHEITANIKGIQDIVLPKALKEALLENLFAPLLHDLEGLFDVKIDGLESFVDICEGPAFLSYDALQEDFARLCFSLEIQEMLDTEDAEESEEVDKETYKNQRLFADMWLAKSLNTQAISEKLLQLPVGASANNVDALKDIPLRIAFELGHVSLSKKSLLGLECCDILLPDVWHNSPTNEAQKKVRLVLHHLKGKGERAANTVFAHTFCGIEQSKLVVLEAWKMSTEKMNTDTRDNEAYSNELDEEAIESLETVVEELETLLTFELERRSIRLSDLQSIGPGYTFALNCDQEAPVTLRVNGKKIGLGRLVDMKGLMGVEIVKLG